MDRKSLHRLKRRRHDSSGLRQIPIAYVKDATVRDLASKHQKNANVYCRQNIQPHLFIYNGVDESGMTPTTAEMARSLCSLYHLWLEPGDHEAGHRFETLWHTFEKVMAIFVCQLIGYIGDLTSGAVHATILTPPRVPAAAHG